MARTIPYLFPAKLANAVLDYSMDFSAWLEPGDSIVSYSVTASPSGLTIGSPVLSYTEGEVLISSYIAGGTPGQSYNIFFQVITAKGRTDIEVGILNILNY